ncbi:hypothetical protein D3C87_1209510 [compost metagenome]
MEEQAGDDDDGGEADESNVDRSTSANYRFSAGSDHWESAAKAQRYPENWLPSLALWMPTRQCQKQQEGESARRKADAGIGIFSALFIAWVRHRQNEMERLENG